MKTSSLIQHYKTNFRKSLPIAFLLVGGIVIPVTEVYAYPVQIIVDEIKATRTTETWPNTDDETYFILSGASQKVAGGQITNINVPRISPPPPQDYYALAPGGPPKTNIVLWQGEMGTGATTNLAIVVAEQDNGQLAAIKSAVTAGAAAAGAALAILIGDPQTAGTLSGVALNSCYEMVDNLVTSIGQSADDVIGGIGLVIYDTGSGLTANWQAVASAQQFPGATPLSKIFRLTGAGSNYEMTISVQVDKPPTPPFQAWIIPSIGYLMK